MSDKYMRNYKIVKIIKKYIEGLCGHGKIMLLLSRKPVSLIFSGDLYTHIFKFIYVYIYVYIY